ncbi:hypothetical protein [Methylobacter sp.]|uniref:hypothetical protein n=1 Tax=Methylobacter sp. TaxID=2051955 RepID=UPI002FE12AE2
MADNIRVAECRQAVHKDRVAEIQADIYSHRARHAIPDCRNRRVDDPAQGRGHDLRAPTI